MAPTPNQIQIGVITNCIVDGRFVINNDRDIFRELEFAAEQSEKDVVVLCYLFVVQQKQAWQGWVASKNDIPDEENTQSGQV